MLPSFYSVIILITVSSSIIQSNGLPAFIKIGGLFAEGEEEQEAAFRFAIERINDDPKILPGITLVARVERVFHSDPYRTSKQICDMATSAIVGIIGPTDEISSMQARSVCDAIEIPHVQVHGDIETRNDALSISLYPKPQTLAQAYLDVIKGLGWDEFAVIYDVNDEVVLYKDIFKTARDKNWVVHLYQLDRDQPYRDTFMKIKRSGKNNIIIDVKHKRLMEVMKHAQQVGLLTEAQSYIITSLDLVTAEIEDFMFSGAKIFSFRLIEDTNMEMQTLFNDWTYLSGRTQVSLPVPNRLKTESALVYDAVKLMALSVQSLDKIQAVDIIPVSCDDEKPWPHGTSLVNYMRPTIFRGLSGYLTFNEFGHRTSFNLDLLNIREGIVTTFGTWNTRGGLNITPVYESTFLDHAMQQRPLIVTTVETEPFTMKRIASDSPKGNARFEGYAIDLIDELSMLLNFKYEIRIAKDRKYGSEQPDGSWNGMIGEVLRDEADLAIVDLTITRKREKVVDFTLPFMTTGVSILFLKPQKVESSLFGFLSPFTISVWIWLCLATALISMIFFLCGRLSPYEWDNPFPCKEDLPILMNECSVKNSFWFTVGSLMQQGSDVAPKSMSTRVIGAVWYFFTLIIVASYTANLAAFLTIEVVSYPFNDATELASQKKIQYGCSGGGSTRLSFRDSPDPILRKLSENMEKNQAVFVKDNTEGKDRVLAGNYAFFMEAAAIEYAVERVCNFTQIGGLLDSKGYGIATKKNSPIRHELSRGILKLQEKGTLHILYERWWKQKRGGGACLGGSSGGASPMALANVGGVFVVLVLGSFFSFLMAIAEFMYKTRKAAPDDKTWKEDMAEDVRFVFRLQETVKANRKRKNSSISSKGKQGKITAESRDTEESDHRQKPDDHPIEDTIDKRHEADLNL